MRIGIDFDNTLVVYDGAFHRAAESHFGMPPEVPKSKALIRSWFRDGPLGEPGWVELQGIVYGTRISEAELAPGAESFLRTCVERGATPAIISHKTEYPAAGPRVNLRDAARGFLRDRQLIGEDTGLSFDCVFFETTREEKISRIQTFGCEVFIDDLPEVFNEPAFPAGVKKLLFDPNQQAADGSDRLRCRSWVELTEAVFGAGA